MIDKPKSKRRPWDSEKPALRPMQKRTRIDFYHTARWKRESRAFRKANPLCSKCKAEGIIYPSEVTDHIIPLEICEDPWDWDNWDGLCKRHNNIKAANDRKMIQKHRKNNTKYSHNKKRK